MHDGRELRQHVLSPRRVRCSGVCACGDLPVNHRLRYLGVRLACLAAAMSWAAPALAQREVPIGGRTATMGGAGTAAGNDSAMPYLNPAGAAGLPNDIFAVSASIYAYQNLQIDDFFFPEGFPDAYGPADVQTKDISAGSIIEAPTSVMYFKRLSPPNSEYQMLAGVSLVIPSLEQTEIVANQRTRFETIDGTLVSSGSVARSRTDYYVGPTYALGIGKNVRLGLSLYALYVQEFESLQFTQFFTAAGGSIVSQVSNKRAIKRSSFGLAPIAGVQLQLAENIWIGAGLAPPSLHLDGSLEREFESSGGGNDPANLASSTMESITTSVSDGHYYADRPLRLNLGFAYDNRKSFSLAADAVYFHARNNATAERGTLHGTDFRTGQLPRVVERPYGADVDVQPIIDLSAGAEIVLTPVFALRFGALTAFSNQPKFELDVQELYRFRMRSYGATLGLGITFGSFDTTIGAAYLHSVGTFVTLDERPESSGGTAGGPALVDASSNALFLVLSSAVTFEEAKETIRKTLPGDIPIDPTLIEPVPGFDSKPMQPPPTKPALPAAAPTPAPTSPAPSPSPPPPLPPPPTTDTPPPPAETAPEVPPTPPPSAP
jgi:hypothetical protein